ncbi:MAG: hypothetical protein IKM31_08925 [Oscillospiraceae bacterium]|nr:hypothetical protein [Oscillospiraceae bacterium]
MRFFTGSCTSQLNHRGQVHGKAGVLLGLGFKALQREGDVHGLLFIRDDRLIGNDLEADDQFAVFLPHPVCLIGGALVGVGQLDFVVIGTLLGHREQGDLLPLHQGLLAGLLQLQAPDDAVRSHLQLEEVAFKNKIVIIHTGSVHMALSFCFFDSQNVLLLSPGETGHSLFQKSASHFLGSRSRQYCSG